MRAVRYDQILKLHFNYVERRGRMVRTSDSQPEGRGFESRRRAKARRGICEQDTLKSTARGSQNKQNCLRHVPLTLVKKKLPNIEEKCLKY
jgi:hypothetical protein